MCSSAKARVRFPCPEDNGRRVAQAAADLENSTTKCVYLATVSIAENLPLVLVVRRRHDVAENFEGALHRSDPGRTIFDRRRRKDFGHWLTKPRDSNRLFRGANLFQHGETLGLEFRNGYFLHGLSLIVILSYYGQSIRPLVRRRAESSSPRRHGDTEKTPHATSIRRADPNQYVSPSAKSLRHWMRRRDDWKSRHESSVKSTANCAILRCNAETFAESEFPCP